MNKKQMEKVHEEFSMTRRKIRGVEINIFWINISLVIGFVVVVASLVIIGRGVYKIAPDEIEESTEISGCVERVGESSVLVNGEQYFFSIKDVGFVEEGDYITLEEDKSTWSSYNYKIKSIRINEEFCLGGEDGT